MNKTIFKRTVSIILSIVMLISCLPIVGMAAAGSSTSVADPKTLSDWENWFSSESSRYAGGVFLDKSVYTATEAKADDYFEDIRSLLSFGTDSFGNENFMVALSALGSNSEVLGYSHTPTDTMLVLDASTSMGTGDASSSSIDDMVSGANEAIKRLLALNNYNRVGVVIYNGTASVLLPLDRYVAGNANGDILRFERSRTGGSGSWRDPYTYENRIYVASDVKDSNGANVATTYNAQAQGTYTQGGIYAAAQEFLRADTVIEDGKIQGGTNRMPIMVLMTDGEPSYRTQTGSNTTINKYNVASNNNADRSNFREDDVTAFSTMLTAAWAEAEITAHYNMDTRFYTLGYALSANHQYAQNVLDPMNPNNALAARFSGYATQYLAMNQNATAAFRNENNQQVFRVTRATSPERVKTLDYVDKYWQAAQASQLSAAFDEIVDEIIIQSRYYSTLVSNNNYAQDGFISFTDEIGTYMEVKDIKGIYIGDGKLVSGGMFAEFATTGKVADYDQSNYSEAELEGFENEILNAVSERFGISLSEAMLLINTAKENGYISYTSPDAFSNYIAWYADEDNNYIAPFTNANISAQNNAKYIVRSYFYMGDVTQNRVETSMLYALVRVREDIETGRQIVDMNVPAALLPMVTYTITVDGDTLTQQNITGMTCEQEKPISLLYEVGLDRAINPINIGEKVGESFRKDADGVYTFYTNRWRDDAGNPFGYVAGSAHFTPPADPDPHVFNHGIMNTTVTQFIPSLENERYYFTENKQILDQNHHVYSGSKPTASGEYYVPYHWVEVHNNQAELKTAYDKVSSEIFKKAENVIEIDGKTGWFIKKGTPQYYFGEEIDGEQAHSHKTANTTNTLAFSDYPQVVYHESEGHTGYHMLNYHGNNGRINAEPAQGIKLSKTVEEAVEGAPDSFDFEIALSGTQLAASYPVYIEHADGTATTATKNVEGGKLTVTLADGDVAYIYDLPVGTEYTVKEGDNAYYAPSSSNASGTVALHTLSAVDFKNHPKTYGSLLVAKAVTHPFGTEAIPQALIDKKFDITVAFEGSAEELEKIEAPNGITSADNNKTFRFTLTDGTDVLFTNIPEGVGYKVTESNLPAGFTLVTPAAALEGTIQKDHQSNAELVNNYAPAPVDPNITLTGTKTIPDFTWTAGTFEVALQQVRIGGNETTNIGAPIIIGSMKPDGKTYTFKDLAPYDRVGHYSYMVYEVEPANKVADIAYDKTFGLFTVVVTDEDVDGALEVSEVIVHYGSAALSGDRQSGWTVTKDFTNLHLAETETFTVQKSINGSTADHAHDSGILFGLFADKQDADPIYAALTDETGAAEFTINILQSDFRNAVTYYLREIAPLEEDRVVGMTYDTDWKYSVTIHWPDGAAEPTVTYKTEGGNEVGKTELIIDNAYDSNVPPPSIVFRGKKTLNGGALRAGDAFTFELYETDGDFLTDGLSAKQTKVVTDANGTISFDAVSFNSTGTKYIVVQEVRGAADGITYDATQYHITLDVVKGLDASGKTVLKIDENTLHIHKTGHGDVGAEELNFNNTYAVNDEEEVVVCGKKTLHGRTLVEGEFEFEILAQTANAPLPAKTKVKNDLNGNFAFPAIRYDVADKGVGYQAEYAYTIREVVPADADKKGITYNSNGKSAYTLVVRLEDDGLGGIKKTVTLDGQAVADVTVAFENTYGAAATNLTFRGTKTFNKERGEFTFALYETGKEFAIRSAAVKTAKATVANGSGAYSINLEYASADKGYHYYVIKEVVPAAANGISYDVAEYHITVNVLDNGHGELEAHVMSIHKAHTSETATKDTLNFANVYEAAPTEYALKGKKTLVGKELKADLFEFRLSDNAGEIATVKNAADGSFAFPLQTLDEARDYVFYVEEINGGSTIKGIAYDAATFTVTIPVLDDGLGQLYVDEANIKIQKEVANQKTDVSEISFTNEYSATATDELYLEGVKQIDGTTLKKGDFTFELYEADKNFKKGAFLKDAANEADGTFKFDKALTFDKADTYYYVILEKKGDKEYIEYDDTVYGVVVTVEDNGEGKLFVEKKEIVVVAEGGTTAAQAVGFLNQYVPAEAKIRISGQKTLEGRSLKQNEFKFLLYPANDQYAVDPNAVAKEAKNKADGSFAFEEITVDQVGTYYFVVREDAETKAERVTNDTAVYRLAVEIKDDLNGKLYEAGRKIEKVGSAEPAQAIAFKNVYTPKPQDIPLEIGVQKTVVNKGSEKIGPEGFEFLLEEVDSRQQFKAQSDAEGKATFALRYSESDIGKTYTYKLTELNGGKAHVQYSAAEYTVTVAIALNESNELVAALTQNGEKVAAVVAAFENVYDHTPDPTPDPDPKPDPDPTPDPDPKPNPDPKPDPNPAPSDSPDTGDETNLGLWFALLFASGGGLLLATLYLKKKEETEQA